MNSMAKAVACACVMRTISRIAERNGIKLIVGLVTGRMSGRQFVPPVFEGR